ncbi:prepilin peptidase [Wenxinia marina]|uniref:Flp pilus assembly protein, protease CpaA n=1 Tax=Wenxinia marina DSM 24838 TaxID=1123501 RepID=A0A0D0Q043_9RHOB|nr:prepilin peptidase [Wenxinia marina]KIQ67979.1 Flp pilus assembly protein, protease CpaA [Wenxinia marina DSM 24838]GGL75733.1 membrane protein [Wenxinia marina]
METPALAAACFLVPALPIGLWVAWSDLSRMKIPNKAVLALALGFAVVGPFVLPLADYGWRWVHLAVMLVVGIVANAVRLMGAGDAKFIAAAAPYVALGDLGTVALILAAASVLAFAGHRLARVSPLRARAPDWHSWEAGNRFPFGLPLAMALIAYLALAALAA